jgi:MFS transporter, BCD family, chlorophyll transporter
MTHLTWPQILRLGLVQMALGSIIVLTTATMNRVMVVELAFPAMLPGILVAIYDATQLSRPRFGHRADLGRRRTPWIIGGMAVLCLGGIGAALSIAVMETNAALGIACAVAAFLVIGLGLGASATNLLALLASRVAPDRKAAAGSAVWIMMIAGLATTGIGVGQVLDPYTAGRLVIITATVAAIAMTLTIVAIWGIEGRAVRAVEERGEPFRQAIREVWADPRARGFAIFVFAAMLAYNTQDLILEPYAGHVFGMTPGQSTQLGGMHHAGALLGMLIVLAASSTRHLRVPVKAWIVGGCLASGAALVALGVGGQADPAWPIQPNVFVLGLSNGVFAVAAIGAMMGLASEGARAREGTRMGLFGAAQAIAFGLGSFLGTAAVDIMRSLTADPAAYGTVFILEGGLFLVSALLAARIAMAPRPGPALAVAGE